MVGIDRPFFRRVAALALSTSFVVLNMGTSALADELFEMPDASGVTAEHVIADGVLDESVHGVACDANDAVGVGVLSEGGDALTDGEIDGSDEGCESTEGHEESLPGAADPFEGPLESGHLSLKCLPKKIL